VRAAFSDVGRRRRRRHLKPLGCWALVPADLSRRLAVPTQHGGGGAPRQTVEDRAARHRSGLGHRRHGVPDRNRAVWSVGSTNITGTCDPGARASSVCNRPSDLASARGIALLDICLRGGHGSPELYSVGEGLAGTLLRHPVRPASISRAGDRGTACSYRQRGPGGHVRAWTVRKLDGEVTRS